MLGVDRCRTTVHNQIKKADLHPLDGTDPVDTLERIEISAPERVYSSYPTELSGGMRQRVLITMALLSEPDLLIADEPGAALNATTEEKVINLLDDLVEHTSATVLYITHDLGVAQKMSNHINVMK
jgi:peptide/nickel transport system ATP-binding protein